MAKRVAITLWVPPSSQTVTPSPSMTPRPSPTKRPARSKRSCAFPASGPFCASWSSGDSSNCKQHHHHVRRLSVVATPTPSTIPRDGSFDPNPTWPVPSDGLLLVLLLLDNTCAPPAHLRDRHAPAVPSPLHVRLFQPLALSPKVHAR